MKLDINEYGDDQCLVLGARLSTFLMATTD
jgi:hypothetical protein